MADPGYRKLEQSEAVTVKATGAHNDDQAKSPKVTPDHAEKERRNGRNVFMRSSFNSEQNCQWNWKKIGIAVGISFLILAGGAIGGIILSKNSESRENRIKSGNSSKVIQVCSDSNGCTPLCPEGLVLVQKRCQLENILAPGNHTLFFKSTSPSPVYNSTTYRQEMVTNATQKLTPKPKIRTTKPKQRPTTRPITKQLTSPVIKPTSSTNGRPTLTPIVVPEGMAMECIVLRKSDLSSIGDRQLYSISNTTGRSKYCKPHFDPSKGSDVSQHACEQRALCDRGRDTLDNKFIVSVSERKEGPPLWCKLCKIRNTVRDSGFGCVKSSTPDCGDRFMRLWVKNSGCYQCISNIHESCGRKCTRQSVRSIMYATPIPGG